MKKIYVLLIIIGVFVLDQASKILILLNSLGYLPFGGDLPQDGYFIAYINEFFNFVLSFNYGMSFSMLSFSSKWFFIIGIILVCTLITVWLRNEKDTKRRIAYSLILGGALGNLFDRFMYGAVVDFIDFHVHLYHWPTFNLADSFICLGAFIYLLSFIKTKKKETNKKRKINVRK